MVHIFTFSVDASQVICRGFHILQFQFIQPSKLNHASSHGCQGAGECAYRVRSLHRTTSLLVTGASSMGGRVGGERAAILESARARAAAPRMRGAAVGGGLLGAKPERSKTYACAYMPMQGSY